MAITLNDNILAVAPKPADAKFGPYISTASAISSLTSTIRYQGMTVIINDGTNPSIEYWFQNGIADVNLVQKSLSGAQIIAALGYTPENVANKNVNNGYAGLDNTGKIPVSLLPSSILIYRGQWDASTNTPHLQNGTGSSGDVWQASSVGTVDFGAGDISFNTGDYVIYNGTEWQKSNSTDSVTSVNGMQGIVVLDTDDISDAGATNKYYSDALVATYGNAHYYPLSSNPAGYLTSATGVSSITGTLDQIAASSATGAVTLSLASTIKISGSIWLGGTNQAIQWGTGGSALTLPSDGVWRFLDSSGGGSPRIILGSASNTFVSFKRNGTTFAVRLGDDSGDGNISAAQATLSSIPALGTAATTFLTSNSGVISSRTAAQVLSDIGALSSSTGAYVNNTTDSTLTRSGSGPYTLGINLANANTWSGQQTFGTSAPIFGTMTSGSVLFAGASGLLSQDNSNFFYDNTNKVVYIGSNTGAFPGTRLQTTGSSTTTLQNNIQNTSNGTSASSDFVATADTGTNTTNYANFGINSSTYSDVSFTITTALDGYFYTVGGNNVIGTATSGKSIIFHTGGTLITDKRVQITDSSTTVSNLFINNTAFTASASGQFLSNFTGTYMVRNTTNDFSSGVLVNPVLNGIGTITQQNAGLAAEPTFSGNPSGFSLATTTTLTNGTYTLLSPTNVIGTGTGLVVTATVTGSGTGVTLAVTTNGVGYKRGDNISIPATSLGGASGTVTFNVTVIANNVGNASIRLGTRPNSGHQNAINFYDLDNNLHFGAIRAVGSNMELSSPAGGTVQIAGGLSINTLTIANSANSNGPFTFNSTNYNVNTSIVASEIYATPNFKIFTASNVTTTIYDAAPTYVVGQIFTVSLTGGSGYTNGTFTVVLTGSATGSGGTLNVTVSGGVVTTINSIGTSAINYKVGDVLTASSGLTGGTGFSVTVTSTTSSGSINTAYNYRSTLTDGFTSYQYVGYNSQPTYNQTGGSTSNVFRGFYHHPTNTSLTGIDIPFENTTGTNYFNTTSGSTGIGVASAATLTGKLQLLGTSSLASLVLGNNLTSSAVNGGIEYDNTNFYASSGGVRYTLNKVITVTATLDFPNTPAQSGSDLTVTATGAAVGDVVSLGVDSGSVLSNSCYTAWVSSTNTVTVRLNNYDSLSGKNPASGTFRVSVSKFT